MVWLYHDNQQLRGMMAELPPAAGSGPGTRSATKLPDTGPASLHAAASSIKAPQPSAPPAPAAISRVSAQGGAFTVQGNEDGTVTLIDPETGMRKTLTMDQWLQLQQQASAAAMDHIIRKPGGPSWSPGQAAGAPNTQQHGDYSTAWAPQSQDGGKEWLQLRYGRAVEISEINIHETYNPGAVSKVSAIMPDGSEKVIWEGRGTPEEGIVERAVKVPPGIRSDQIRIELDTARVSGWNEIDAVELVGRDGTRQWATESTASSYFGSDYRSKSMNSIDTFNLSFGETAVIESTQ